MQAEAGMKRVGAPLPQPPGTLVAVSGAVDHAGAEHPKSMKQSRVVVFFVWEHSEHDEEYRGTPRPTLLPRRGAASQLRGAERRRAMRAMRTGAVQFTPWNCCLWVGCYRRYVEVCKIYKTYTPWQWLGVATDDPDDADIPRHQEAVRPRPPSPSQLIMAIPSRPPAAPPLNASERGAGGNRR
jgi:hypothetical protein